MNCAKNIIYWLLKKIIYAMHNLGFFYEDIMENYELAEKYYLMAIEKGHINSIYFLAVLYEIRKNYDLAEKYYLMAVEKDHADAMYNLAIFYNNIKENYDLGEKYYLMAIDKDDINAIQELCILYDIMDIPFKKMIIDFLVY